MQTQSQGEKATDPVAAVEKAYAAGETDEFVKPVVIVDDSGVPLGPIEDNDGILFFNFRADRARELTRAYTENGFDAFSAPRPKLCGFVTMTQYEADFDLPVAFEPVRLEGILGETISQAGLNQLRIAETEKYAHVTYFFNGGMETPFPNEERLLIPSPRDVETYDQKPAMSAAEVTATLLERFKKGMPAFTALNFANMDMVGHTGVLEAAIQACETVDRCVSRIVPKVLDQGGAVLITADHGNCEQMADEDGNPHTAHTQNRVALILVDPERRDQSLDEGILGDIAPTVLEIIGLAKTGTDDRSLFVEEVIIRPIHLDRKIEGKRIVAATESNIQPITDFITGETLPNVGAEENRQAVEHFLVEKCGFAKAAIRVNVPLSVTVKGEAYHGRVDLAVSAKGRTMMVIKCVAGSPGSWLREMVAAARLLEESPFPGPWLPTAIAPWRWI